MDVADFDKPLPPLPLTTWNDLSWGHLAKTERIEGAVARFSQNRAARH